MVRRRETAVGQTNDRADEHAATAPDEGAIIREIDGACRKLVLAPGAEDDLVAIVSLLATHAIGGGGVPDIPAPAFSKRSKQACQKELKALSVAARRLIAALQELHQPTIAALTRVGFDSDNRVALPLLLLRIAEQAQRADLNSVPERDGLGRKPRPRAHAVGLIAGHAYERLTGTRPTYTTDPQTSRRSGPWPDFLRAVFKALKLEGGSDDLIVSVASRIKILSAKKASSKSR